MYTQKCAPKVTETGKLPPQSHHAFIFNMLDLVRPFRTPLNPPAGAPQRDIVCNIMLRGAAKMNSPAWVAANPNSD